MAPSPDIIRWESDSAGTVVLTIDDPGSRVNTLSVAFIDNLARVVDRLEREREGIRGVILRSAKRTFVAGGDLNRLLAVAAEDEQDFVADLERRKSYTRRLERLDRPVVAVLAGAAMGGGLELALCCHHRIAVDNGRTLVGLPELNLGLLPGAGGIVRTVRRVGLHQALDSVILSGTRFAPTEAERAGLVDTLVGSEEEAMAAAVAWIAAHPTGGAEPARVLDSGRSRYPTPLPSANPAARLAVEVANVAATADLDEALAVESRALGQLVVGAASKGCIQSVFFDTNALRSRLRTKADEAASRPGVHPASEAEGLVRLLSPLADVEDAQVLLADVDGVDDAVRVWLPPAHVHDGQRILEYADDGNVEITSALATLVRSGVLPVGVSPERGSFAEVVAQAAREAAHQAVADGRTPTEVAAAHVWAGLTLPEDLAEVELQEGDSERPQTQVLARQLLDRIAAAAVGAAQHGHLTSVEDLDIISVRAGGFPAWTGGVARWVHC